MRAYYDSCIFINAHNNEHGEFQHCQTLLDPVQIFFDVVISRDLLTSECPISDLIDVLEISFASAGKNILNLNADDIKKRKKTNNSFKKKYETAGLVGQDWNHLMAAIAGESNFIFSTDSDFWDPANKKTPGMKKKSSFVKGMLKKDFSLAVLLPSELSSAK